MNEVNLNRIHSAQVTTRQLLPIVKDIEGDFRSARNWGIVDVLGGGVITDIIKHVKLNRASQKLNLMNQLLNRLRSELQQIIIPADFNMNQNFFLTFADFYFDGALVDIYMTVKINESLKQLSSLHEALIQLDEKLSQIR